MKVYAVMMITGAILLHLPETSSWKLLGALNMAAGSLMMLLEVILTRGG